MVKMTIIIRNFSVYFLTSLDLDSEVFGPKTYSLNKVTVFRSKEGILPRNLL